MASMCILRTVSRPPLHPNCSVLNIRSHSTALIALLVSLQITIASGTCPFAYFGVVDRCCPVAATPNDGCCADAPAGSDCAGDCDRVPAATSPSEAHRSEASAPTCGIGPVDGPCTAAGETGRHDRPGEDHELPTPSGCCLDGSGCSFTMLVPHVAPAREAATPAILFAARPDSQLIATDPMGLDHPPC